MRVIYIFDALCGWCYGFSPVVNRLKEEFSSQLAFDVISGGMILSPQKDSISKLADHFSRVYQKVEKKTGVKPGYGLLDQSTGADAPLFDSFPPSKALRVFRELKDGLSVNFAMDIQAAIHRKGIDLTDVEAYAEMAAAYGVSRNDFEILWSSVDYDVRTREDFILARQLSVSNFPTLFFEHNSSYHLIAEGYTPFEVIKERLEYFVDSASAAVC